MVGLPTKLLRDCSLELLEPRDGWLVVEACDEGAGADCPFETRRTFVNHLWKHSINHEPVDV